MTSALCHLEMKQSLHRDVKPGNVAQCENGSTSNWKLLDFDSACCLDSPQQAACIGGTMSYYRLCFATDFHVGVGGHVTNSGQTSYLFACSWQLSD